MSRAMPGALLVALLVALGGCGGEEEPAEGTSWVADLRAAVAAVDAVTGGAEYFEVTATPGFTNLFVAAKDATAAVPYLFSGGVLEPPGPALPGADGNTFDAAAIDLDEGRVLAQISDELPDSTVASLSVEGGPGGSVRYVVAVRSNEGGTLDVVVGPTGEIISVTPL